jgi:hypothetical protein
MAKRDRENRLREKRQDKQAKKAARKLAAEGLGPPLEMGADEQVVAPGGPPALEDVTQPLPDV